MGKTKDFSGYVGQTINGYTIIKIIPKEEMEQYGLNPKQKHVMVLTTTGCPKCGEKPRRLENVLRKDCKTTCVHEKNQMLAENSKRMYTEMRECEANSYVGTTQGTWRVECVEPKSQLPFKAKETHSYLRCRCERCNRICIIDAANIVKARCTCMVERENPEKYPQGGLTAKYPRLHGSLKKHFYACYEKSTNSYGVYGGKGWHFHESWLIHKEGKVFLNTSRAIQDCVDKGWDESDPDMILEKDKLANELRVREIGPRTIRCVSRKENGLYHFED